MNWLEKHWLWIVALVVVYFLFKGAKAQATASPATAQDTYQGN